MTERTFEWQEKEFINNNNLLYKRKTMNKYTCVYIYFTIVSSNKGERRRAGEREREYDYYIHVTHFKASRCIDEGFYDA